MLAAGPAWLHMLDRPDGNSVLAAIAPPREGLGASIVLRPSTWVLLALGAGALLLGRRRR